MSKAAQVENHETPAVAVATMPGEMLAAARKAQNWSLAEVANRLKLSVSQVEALERGAYDRLPGPVFVRGFTRNYARLLKLDPEAAVRAVDESLPRAAAEEASALAADTPIPMPEKSRRWPVLAGAAAVIFLGAALVDVLWPEVPEPASTTPSQASTSAQSPVHPPAEAVAAATAVVTHATEAGAAVTAEMPATPGTAPAAMPATYQPAAADGSRPLKLVFDQRSWVQVKDRDGKVVFERLNEPGTTRELSARPPLALIIGNAHGVRLTYGDRAIDLTPYTRVDVARLALE